MELGKISIFATWKTERTNVEIWSVIHQVHVAETGIQDTQIITAASMSLILQAASDMSIS